MTDFVPQNFTMKSGDSKTLEVTVRDANGVPIPLAGTSAMTWRAARTARSAPALSKTIGAGITILSVNAAAGQSNCGRCDIVITSADSEPMDGEYFHDCHMVDATSAHSTIFQGRANFTPNMT
jgi:hypothetical protein